MESELAVLEALVEHLELKRFALFGSCESGQVAAAYAARHPDVLSSLIVYGSCARGADLAPDEVRRSVLALVRAHWGLGSRVLADIWFPDAPAELTAMFARLQRARRPPRWPPRCWTCSTGSTWPTCCRRSGCRRSWRTGGAAGRSGSSSAGSWPR
jgi:pimeloyl-ACP methyl ester carboxylesterase